MWESPVHKVAIINESKSGKQFVKFINMLMNDTTFLLDESMDALKRIHEVQEEMADTKKWAELGQEAQQTKLRNLNQDERQCRSYLTLARETVDMFHYLTQDIKEPFLRPELVDRLAAMLNFNLKQLCGSKCKNLKVDGTPTYAQCGNFRIFLSFRFHVKSFLENVEVLKLLFFAIFGALNFANLVNSSL